ncbi:MAG: response regulator [Magnetococcales bacterium]|nr:response regulator [Magnetococcales bacterium]
MLRRQFSGETDLELHATQDPQGAIALAEQLQPMVIILDLVMPGLDGVSLLKQFRQKESFAEMPIIMLSTIEESQLKAIAFESGANDYLIKLPDRVEMLARVRYHAKAYLTHLDKKRVQQVLKESEHRFRIVTDAVSEAIVALDQEGRITFWNQGAKKTFGFKKQEILGDSLLRLVPERLHEEYRSFFTEQATDRENRMSSGTLEGTGVKKGGEEFPLEFSINSWSEGNQTFFVSVMRDITKRKLNEEKIHEQSIKLLEMEKAASKAKSDFVANLSHEIRTPMNGIICLTDLALRIETEPDTRDYLFKIANASQSLMGCLNDILDFSKIEAGKLDLYPVMFHPGELFHKLADMFGSQVADKGIELVFSIPDDYFPTLFGDSKRLEQILINLLRNAIKFTGEGTIVVRAHPTPKQIGPVSLQFSIEDTGIGIAPERIEKLFSPFAQADPSIALKYGGTGLGLNICKQLVEIMGGRIWAESTLGRGSLFAFTVNLVYPSESNKPLIVPDMLRDLKILVADDHEMTRTIMEAILRGFKFTVTTVDSGEAALAELTDARDTEAPYQLVFMDWRMSGMDGIETAKAIHQEFANRDTPAPLPKIIMLTAFGKNTIQKTAEQSGIDLFLHKPVTQAHLFNAILEVFGKRISSNQHVEIQVLNEELATSSRIGGARVLLAEDNYINQQVASELLARVGVTVEIANNGQEAVEKVQGHTYDAVLMDVQMPIMDGHAATRAIRSDPGFQTLPIIAMTAHVLESAREASLASGMNDHITKPIDIKQLYATLTRWINPDGNDRRFGVPTGTSAPPQREASGILPPVLAGIDLRNAMIRLGGQERFFKAVLMRFKDHANVGHQIHAALDNENLETALHLAHMMTGIAGNLSATRLQQAAHELELAIEQRRIREEPSLLKEFDQALHQVIQAIHTLRPDFVPSPADREEDTPSRTSHSPQDQAVIVPLLKELFTLLKTRDTDAELTLETLKQVLNRKNLQPELQGLEACIQRLDYQGAQQLLQKLQTTLNFPVGRAAP